MTTKDMTFSDLRENLMQLREQRFDVVLSTEDMTSAMPMEITLPEVPNVITDRGVGIYETHLRLTEHALQQLATKFRIPVKYLRELDDAGRPSEVQDIWHHIVETHFRYEPQDVLIRALVEPGSNAGTCRAILSPQYGFVEHFDILTAVFDGLRVAREIHKVDFEPGRASISDTHMRARVNMPGLSVVAEALLRNYTSPFSKRTGLENPNIFLGLEIRNSEVGAGAFCIVPVVVIQVCDNGLTMKKDLFRKVHLGSRMEAGQISHNTMRATMELVSSQTTDYVMNVANVEFLQKRVDELMGLTVKVQPTLVQDHLRSVFTDEQADAIFNAFIDGGDITAFGVAQAMTAVSQSADVSVNDAMELDDTAIDVATQVAKVAV